MQGVKKYLLKNIKKFFGPQLDFRAKLFNIMMFAVILISFIAFIMGIIIGVGLFNLLLCLLALVIPAILLWYSYTSRKYQLCYMITAICIFFGLYPALFFHAGGYYSGMPSFFIFAVLFTIFMLEGRKMLVMVALELAAYIFICVYAYHYPDTIKKFDTEAAALSDIIMGFTVVSVTLGTSMALHLRMYKRRQRELETARKKAEEYAKMKSELFAVMSHEMRTPLTVMSAYAQFAVEQITESGANEQTLADLATISEEAKRLAEMADGTLKIFMPISEMDDTGRLQKKLQVNMFDLSLRLVRLFEPVALRKGMKLSAFIKDKIPMILGDADALAQLLWNLLQNVIIHSEARTITFSVEAEGNSVKITISDDGIGIDPSILPHIFKRGVSGKKGGSGIGLSVCRDIVKQHCGEISIQSEPSAGTTVTVLLRGLVGG